MKRKCFSRGKVVIRGELEPYATYKYSTPGYHSIDFFDHIPFCCRSNGANSIQVSRQNFCQFWRKIDNFYKKIFFSLFLIFWPKYLALVDNFQCQEDLILWNFLYDNCEKKMSADFSCLFTFFKKKFKRFQILLSLR